MLGLSDIESIAHIFEEVLGKASRGEFEITGSFIDTYYQALDAIKNLVSEAVTGEKTDVDVVSSWIYSYPINRLNLMYPVRVSYPDQQNHQKFIQKSL